MLLLIVYARNFVDILVLSFLCMIACMHVFICLYIHRFIYTQYWEQENEIKVLNLAI